MSFSMVVRTPESWLAVLKCPKITFTKDGYIYNYSDSSTSIGRIMEDGRIYGPDWADHFPTRIGTVYYEKEGIRIEDADDALLFYIDRKEKKLYNAKEYYSLFPSHDRDAELETVSPKPEPKPKKDPEPVTSKKPDQSLNKHSGSGKGSGNASSTSTAGSGDGSAAAILLCTPIFLVLFFLVKLIRENANVVFLVIQLIVPAIVSIIISAINRRNKGSAGCAAAYSILYFLQVFLIMAVQSSLFQSPTAGFPLLTRLNSIYEAYAEDFGFGGVLVFGEILPMIPTVIAGIIDIPYTKGETEPISDEFIAYLMATIFIVFIFAVYEFASGSFLNLLLSPIFLVVYFIEVGILAYLPIFLLLLLLRKIING